MKNEKKAKMIADQCRPCSEDFYSGIYQGVLLATEQKNKIKDILELQYLSYSRAKEMLEINGRRAYMYHPVGVEFCLDAVTVRFEDNNSDYLDFEFVTLSLDELEMTDEKWNEYINEKKLAKYEKERKRSELIQQSALEAKKKQYFDLKKELGY